MRKNLLKYSVMVLGLAFGLCTSAYGLAFRAGHAGVPEVDPSLAIGGLTLLAGTIAVLRIRRKK